MRGCFGAGLYVYGDPMASPQDAPTRKKQKLRARRKLALWRQKREASQGATAGAAAK